MTYPLGADVTKEPEIGRDATAVGLAYDHLMELLGEVLAELPDHVPSEASYDVREHLQAQAARFAEDSLMPAIVRATAESGESADANFRADFEWAFRRGTRRIRKAFARVAEDLPVA